LAWLFGEKKFGQYTYEHWFDEEIEIKTEAARQKETEALKTEKPQETKDSRGGLTDRE
jgi:hypothetical protein